MTDEYDDSEILKAYSEVAGKAEYHGALDHLHDILYPSPSRSSTLDQLQDPFPSPQTLGELRERVRGVAAALGIVVKEKGFPGDHPGMYSWRSSIKGTRSVIAIIGNKGLRITGYSTPNPPTKNDLPDYQIGFPGYSRDGLTKGEEPSWAYDRGYPSLMRRRVTPALTPANTEALGIYFNVLERAINDIHRVIAFYLN